MKTKQLFVAAIIVISAITVTSCKKDEAPFKISTHQLLKMDMPVDTSKNLGGGHDHTNPPPH